MHVGRHAPRDARAHLAGAVAHLCGRRGIGELEAHALETRDQEVAHRERGATAKVRPARAFGTLNAVRVAAQRDVVNLWVRARQQVVVELVVVGLDAVVGVVAALGDGDELRPTAPAERPVEAVVGGVGGDRVLDVGRAAEPFQCVVAVHVHLDVLVGAAAAHALKGNAIQFVVGAELDAGELDAHVAHGAAAVVRVGAAIDAGIAFTGAFAAFEVDRGTAVDDQAAPVATGAVAHGLVAGEHDRRRPGTDRVEPAAAQHHQGADAAGLADDAGAGGDVERRAVIDEHRAP